jgi:ATP-binding cassette subfamily F protein 3
VEETLAALGKEAAVIDGALSDPRLYARDNPGLLARATARRAAIAREVEALETEWLELQERLEDAA